MGRWRVPVFLFAVLLLLLSGCQPVFQVQSSVPERYLLIDPGHGGADGGTVAEDGTQEKDINLEIGLTLYDLLQVCGFPVMLTRDADVSIHSADADSLHNRKVSDMHNRLALYEGAQAVISVHQNHYSVSKYSGAQVFYSPNHAAGSRLADAIQQSIKQQLQPDNTRQIKKAGDGIFLLYHTKTPAVLVECGFLSNPTERENLKDPAYRQRLAFAVVGGYWTFLVEE